MVKNGEPWLITNGWRWLIHFAEILNMAKSSFNWSNVLVAVISIVDTL